MQKFKDNRKIKTVTSTLVFLFVIGIGVYFLRGSYAKYEVVDSFTLIEGQVPSFTKIKSISGNIVENLPTIASTDENSCGDNGVVQVSHTGVTGTTNDAEFQKTEYRYCGTDPNNYVTFNEEEAGWRIIGLVNTPEGQRIKLIRAESIGDFSWDLKQKETQLTLSYTLNYGLTKPRITLLKADPHGAHYYNESNNWSNATLMTLLNVAYYNKTREVYYTPSDLGVGGGVIKENEIDFSSTGLTSDSKEMIDTVTWNLGGDLFSLSSESTKEWYNLERNTDVYGTNPILWKGQIGLMYPSDYGYATGGGSTTPRSDCLESALNDSASFWRLGSECINNNYLYFEKNPWLLTPSSDDEDCAFLEHAGGIYSSYVVLMSGVESSLAVHPTIYLKINVQITDGTGIKENPYILG